MLGAPLVTTETSTEMGRGDLQQYLWGLLLLDVTVTDPIHIGHDPSPDRRLPHARRLATPLLSTMEKGDIDTGQDLNHLDHAPGHLRDGMRAAPERAINRRMTAVAATSLVTAT